MIIGRGVGHGGWNPGKKEETMGTSQSPDDGHDEQLFAWAIAAPVLQKHYSIVAPNDRSISVCACSPTTRRTIEQWARHVSDEIARNIA
ncbi:hypothetical protein [Mycobacterium sp. C31M]